MELINGLLGFAVLTSPLWLIFILLPISIWIAFKITKRFKSKSVRVAGSIGIFLLIFLAIFADEIVGKIYFQHLCETEAGVKVYQTVELPTEYWDEAGRPRFLNSRGVLVTAVLGDRFEWRSHDELDKYWFIKIDKKRWILQDTKSKKDLGEKVTFNRYYGWLNQFSTAPNMGESCRDLWVKNYNQNDYYKKENSDEIYFLLKIFIPPPTQK